MNSLLLTLFCVTVANQEPTKPDLRPMQMASYFAGSMAVDQSALGGFGTSENYPNRLDRSQLPKRGVRALLTKSREGLTITLANGGGSESWFWAGDGRVLAWLEAKDAKGKWQPIEYLPWYTCGNSYHRVQLPAGHGWTWNVTVPKGAHQSSVRWHYKSGQDEMLSNVVRASIPIERFHLDAKLSKMNEIRTDWGTPTLMPKAFGR